MNCAKNVFLSSLLLINFSVNGMNGSFPTVEKNNLHLVEVGKDTKITPHFISIYNGSWQKKEERTIYHRKSVNSIVVNCDDSLAPEAFCKKIALLAQKYNISVPIVPFMEDGLDKLNIGSNAESYILFFPKEYIEDPDHLYLEFLIGHELGHGDNMSREYIIEKDFTQTIIPNLITNGIGLVGTFLCADNSFVYYSLMLYFGCATLLQMIVMSRINRSIEVCHDVELACDAAAVEKFGHSDEEKIAVAQQGIAFFEEAVKKESESVPGWLARMYNLVSEGFDRHPLESERIKNLENIIGQINSK